jgi:fumarylpyruvate hydrolase
LYFQENRYERIFPPYCREMGHDPEQEPPFFFFKPQSALATQGEPFVMPAYSQQVEHEIELVIAIGGVGSQLSVADAGHMVCGFTVGLDMTCRDIQKQAKASGRPWELAKGFDGSAPCGNLRLGTLAHLETLGDLVLTLNGEEVQRGNWRNMLWSVAELIAEVSRYIQLLPGDLIFTGTPAGVGVVKAGDELCARIEGLADPLIVKVTSA